MDSYSGGWESTQPQHLDTAGVAQTSSSQSTMHPPSYSSDLQRSNPATQRDTESGELLVEGCSLDEQWLSGLAADLVEHWPAGLTTDLIEQCARTLDAMEDVSCLTIAHDELPMLYPGCVPLDNLEGCVPVDNLEGFLPVENLDGYIPVENLDGYMPLENMQVMDGILLGAGAADEAVTPAPDISSDSGHVPWADAVGQLALPDLPAVGPGPCDAVTAAWPPGQDESAVCLGPPADGSLPADQWISLGHHRPAAGRPPGERAVAPAAGRLVPAGALQYAGLDAFQDVIGAEPDSCRDALDAELDCWRVVADAAPLPAAAARLAEVECELTVSEETAEEAAPPAGPAADHAPYLEHNYDYPLEPLVAGEVRQSADHVYASRPASPSGAACSGTDHRYAYSPPAALTEEDLIRSISDQLGLPQDHGYSQPQSAATAPVAAEAAAPAPPRPDAGRPELLELPEPCLVTEPCLDWEPSLDEPAGHWVDPNVVMGLGVTGLGGQDGLTGASFDPVERAVPDSPAPQALTLPEGGLLALPDSLMGQTALLPDSLAQREAALPPAESPLTAQLAWAVAATPLLPFETDGESPEMDNPSRLTEDCLRAVEAEPRSSEGFHLMPEGSASLVEGPAVSTEAPAPAEEDLTSAAGCSPPAAEAPSPPAEALPSSAAASTETNIVIQRGATAEPGRPAAAGPDPERLLRQQLRQLAAARRPVTRVQLRRSLVGALEAARRRGPADGSRFLTQWAARWAAAEPPPLAEKQARVSYPPYFKLLVLRFTEFMTPDAVAEAFCIRTSLLYRWKIQRTQLTTLAKSREWVRARGAGKKRKVTDVDREFSSWLEKRVQDASNRPSYEEARQMAKKLYSERGLKAPRPAVWMKGDLNIEARRRDETALRWLLTKFECGQATTRAALAEYGVQPGGRFWSQRLLSRYPELRQPHCTWNLRPPERLQTEAEDWVTGLELNPESPIFFMAEVPIVSSPAPCAVGPPADTDHAATLLISCSLDGAALPSMLILKGVSGRVYSDGDGLLTARQPAGRLDAARASLWLQLVGCRCPAGALLLNGSSTPRPELLERRAVAAGRRLLLVPAGLAALANPLMASRHRLMVALATAADGDEAGLLAAVRAQVADWRHSGRLAEELARAQPLYRPQWSPAG